MKASLSMAGRTVAPLALVFTALAASAAHAQSPRGRVVVAPNSPTRVAGIAPPPAPAQQSYGYGSTPSVQLGETVFGSVPAIVLGDGRVLVDFGYGYEQIGRPCPYAYGYGCQSYGGPIAPFTPINPGFPPAYNTPQYAPPAYGSPMYPGGGYNQPTYNQPPGYGYNQPTGLPTAGYGADGRCPPHYVPTGGYPPCVDPVRVTTGGGLAPAGGGAAPAASRPMPVRGGGYGSARPRAAGVYRR
jgi:hypothetical protein